MNLGGITNRLLDGVNQTVFDTQGSYVVTDSTSGRTTVTWTVNNGAMSQFVLYPRNDGGFVMLEVDGNAAAEGMCSSADRVRSQHFFTAGEFRRHISRGRAAQ